MTTGQYFEVQFRDGTKDTFFTCGESKQKIDGDRPYIKMMSATKFGSMMTIHPEHFARIVADTDMHFRPIVDGNVLPFVKREQLIQNVVVNASKTVSTHSNTTPRSGSKKERSIAIYHEQNGDKHSTIERFKKELEMTQLGAQTYYYNCKKG